MTVPASWTVPTSSAISLTRARLDPTTSTLAGAPRSTPSGNTDCTMGSWHGVTSVTIGNCGFGFAPVKAKDVERSMLALSRNESISLEPMRVSMKVDWETFPQYMDRLSKMPLGINLGHLLPAAPSDYPHPESTFPRTQQILDEILADCSETEKAKIAGGNAARIYHLD